MEYFLCSLAGVARALSVYGYQYMCDVKVVECAMNAVFSGVIHLNHWRLRVVLNILIVMHYPPPSFLSLPHPHPYTNLSLD